MVTADILAQFFGDEPETPAKPPALRLIEVDELVDKPAAPPRMPVPREEAIPPAVGRLRMAEAAIEAYRQRGEEVPEVWVRRRDRAREGLKGGEGWIM